MLVERGGPMQLDVAAVARDGRAAVPPLPS